MSGQPDTGSWSDSSPDAAPSAGRVTTSPLDPVPWPGGRSASPRPPRGEPGPKDAAARPGWRLTAWFPLPLRWPRLAWYQEILAVIAGDILYELIRALAPQHAAQAFHNAAVVTAAESQPVANAEVWFRAFTEGHPILLHIFNLYYTIFHMTVTVGVLVWLWWRRADQYARARTMLFGLTFGGLLIFWVFPVAPPRLVTPEAINALGTPAIAALDGGGIGSALSILVNPYAAFPSLHVGWAAWCAWAVWSHLRHTRLRWLSWLYPLATALVVIGTSNHYVIDVVAGLLLVLLTVVV